MRKIKMENKEKSNILLNSISRIDKYIISNNTKSSIIIAYNSLSIAFYVLISETSKGSYEGIANAFYYIGNLILLVAFVSSIVSIVFSFLAIKPNTGDKVASDNNSIFYYKKIIYHDNIETFTSSSIADLDYDKVVEDLSQNLYDLSIILNKKTEKMKVAIVALLIQAVCIVLFSAIEYFLGFA